MSGHASMNRIFRLVWNDAAGAWIAVAENVRGRGKGAARAAALLAPMLAALGLSLPAHAGPPGAVPAPTQLPSNGVVTSGTAAIVPSGAVLNIDQSTQRAAINWQSFDIGSAAQVNFNQPGRNAATLNRVLDSNPSQIFGKITATGQVFLSNPNGVTFGSSASVDVGGLTATTHGISDADFMAGKTSFTRNGATGSVVNQGELRAALGGYIALLAPEVRNLGVVVARMGTVALASGEAFTLNFDGHSLASLTVQPSAIKAVVDNQGAVLAPGGLIILSARALDRLQGGVVKNTGALEATGLSMKGGRIVLEASERVENSGRINADAGADGSPAGRVTLTAAEIVNSGSISAAAVAPPVATATLPPSSGGSIALSAESIAQTASGTLDVAGGNGGKGGSVTLQAAQSIVLEGSIVATSEPMTDAAPASAEGQGGHIVLTAGHDVSLQNATLDASGAGAGGQIHIEGGGQAPLDAPAAPAERHTLALLGSTQLRVSSRRSSGGNVSLTADRVGLFDRSSIDASGATGGGQVLVGGGFHGTDPSLANASQTVLGAAARIDASATETGDGGRVAVWADRQTAFAGQIAARGGAVSGDGGFVEVSGKQNLVFQGRVDAGADHGAAGTLLLDPLNITVQVTGVAALIAVDQFSDTPTANSIIAPSTITDVTNTGTAVVLQANNDITVNSSITTVNATGTGGTLTFQAGRSITLNAGVTSDNGDIFFTTNDAGADGNRVAATPAVFTNSSLIDAGTGAVTITMGTKDQSGSISAGQVTANNFTIVHNGPTAGAASGQIDLGEITLANDLTITANLARDVTNAIGSVIVRGTATLSVGTGDVTINRATTDFNIIGLTAGDVTLNDTNAMRFAATSLSGNLVAVTHAPMNSTGAVQVAGTTNLSAIAGGFGYADPNINLSNASNNFVGAVTLSVSGTGDTGTGGYAIIRDANAINVAASTTSTYLSVQAGGAATLGTTSAGTSVSVQAGGAVALGTTTAGSSVSVTTTGGSVSTGTTGAGTFLNITGGTSAVDLGTTTLGTDLTVNTTGAITDSGTLVVPQQTILTAGSANDITLDSANNNFNAIRVISGRNTTLVDINAINFGAYNTNFGGYTSRVYGALSVTAGGNISQTRSDEDGYSQITVDGATTFTANNASAPINLYLGSSDPFGGGESNTFTGGITLARNNTNTGFSNVRVRNTSSAAGVLTGLTSVGTLNDVFLRYDNAPSVTLPGMTLSGSLKVAAPSVLNTATMPANTISQTGAIVVAGSTIMAAGSTGDIVLTDAGNNFNQFGIANTGARNVSLVDSNAVVLYAPGYHQGITGNYTVTAGGNISDVQYNLSIPGTATFNAGSNNITLTGTNAYLNILAIPAASNVTIYPQNSVVLDNVAITGSLNLTSRGGGTLTQLASTSVVTGAPSTNTTTLATFNSGITLANAGNVLGNLAISNAAAVTIRESDPITQASAWTTWASNGGTNSSRYAVTLTTSDDQAITLDQANYFGNLTITQVNSGAGSAGAVHVRETADSYFGLTQGGAWTVHGTTRIDGGAYSIALTNANNVLGPLQVLGATGLTNGLASTVTIYAKTNGSADAITDVGSTGAWAAGSGTGASVRLVAYNSTGTTAGGGNVNLTNAGNVLGDLYVKATNVTITENSNITDGASTAWFGADTGWVTTGTTNLVVANPSTKSVTLDNLTNLLGPVGITTTGTPGTLAGVLITDNSDLTQAAIWNIGIAPATLDARNHAIDLSGFGNVLGAVTINTVNGSPTSVAITENDAITQGSAWMLSGVPVTLVAQSGNAITLTNAANILGNLTLTGGAVAVTENDSITQAGAWTTSGITTLNVAAASGFGVTLSNPNNVLGALAIAGTPNMVSIAENDDITQASAWIQGTTPFTLNAGSRDILLSQATNQLGDLTLTAQNATVTENQAAGITDAGAWAVAGTTTLTAGSANPIVLNATGPASNFGTVGIVSASNAEIADIDGIVLGTSTVAAGGILTITAGGAITQTGAISAPSLRLIGTGSANLTNASNSVATLAAGFSGGDLAFSNAGSFAVGVVGGTSGVTIGANDVTLASTTGTVTGLSNVNASSSSLTINTGAALVLPQMSIAGPQTYTAGGAGITLNASLTSTAAGAINFMSPVTLGADLTIQSTNSAINFAGALAGGGNQLTVNAGSGTVDFGGAVSNLGSSGDAGAALALTSSGASFDSTLGANNGLAITGPVVFSDTVTLADGNAASVFTGLVTLGKVGGMNLSGFDGMTFNGGVLLQNGPASIISNNSALAFQTAGTVSGPYALTLNSGTQSLIGLNLMGSDLTSLTVTALSPTIPAGGVTINGAQTYTATGSSSITIAGNVTSTAAGAITFNSPVTVGAGATVTSSNSAVVFAGTVDGNNDLTISSGTGSRTFSGAVGGVAALGDGTGASLVLQGSGATFFGSTVQARSGITAAGAVTFNNNVTLANGDTGSVFSGLVTSGGLSGNSFSGFDGLTFNGGLALVGGPVSVASNGSTLALGGAVSGAQNLSLNALLGAAGTVTGLDQIGYASTLTRLDVTGQTLSLPGTGLAVAGAMSFTAAGGITLNGAVGNSAAPASGRIDFNGPVLLATGAIAVTTANAAVNFNATVDGAQALSVNAGSGTTTFGGAVGGTTALSSLATDAGGTTALNGGSIRTTGAQTYNDAVTLGAATTLTGVNVSFNGTLNGANTLVVNDSGATTFAAIVGGTAALASITTDAPGTVGVNTSAVATTGAQTYNENLTLGANTTFTGTGLTFGGNVDGAYTLTATAGSGALQFIGSVGGSTALDSVSGTGASISLHDLRTTGTQTYTAAGGVTLDGDLITNNANVTITGPTTLAGNSSIFTGAGAGNISFTGGSSTINGAYALSLVAGAGNVVLGGVVGGVTPLAAISVSGYDLTLPGISTVGDANQSFTALNHITLNQSRTLSAPVAFTADADADGSGSFILLNGVSLTASNNTLTISAADLDLQGSSTLSSGSGLMTLIASDDRNIALGGTDALGQMTVSGSELSRMTSSGGLDLKTTGSGWIRVNGITGVQSQNLTGVLGLRAQGSGDVSFITAASTFNAVTAAATGGTINVGVNLNTTNDPITFVTPVAVSGASTINSGGGDIAFQSTLAVDNDLTLTTNNGVLSFGGTVGSNKTLTLNLGGGSVTGLDQLQTALTGLTVNSSSGITLPAFTISGPQVYNTGVITATGDLGGVGIAFNNVLNVVPSSGTALTVNSGTGTLAFNDLASFNANNMSLIGDEINFAKAVTGSGSLLLAPASASRNVAVGGADFPIVGLNLTAADMAWLPIGTLASLTIGSASGTGSLDLAGTLNAPGKPLTLNGGGGISQSGGNLTSGALTLYAAGNGIALDSVGNAFGAVALNGTPTSLHLVNTLDITQLGAAAWALGSADVTLNAGTHDITLLNAGNTFGTLALFGGEVQVAEAAATTLGVSTIGENLGITSAGAIRVGGALAATGNVVLDATGTVTQSAPLTIGGTLGVTTSVAAGNVVLNNSGAAATSIGDTLVGGNYTLTATGDPVSQASGATLQVRGDLTITGSSIVLGGAGNLIGGVTTLPTTNTAVLRQSGVITLGDRNDTGNLTVISERTNRSFGSTQVSGDAIVLSDAANNITGSISVSASPPTIVLGADLQTGIVQSAGTAISVAGVASFTAEASGAGSLGVQLTNAGNQFGALQVSGNTVSVTNSSTGVTTLGNSLATTSLTLGVAGALAQSGPLTTPVLAVTAAGSITLGNVANDAGTLTLTSTGGGAIDYVDANGFVVAGLTSPGANVGLTAGGSGSITQTGAIDNGAALALHAGGAVTLTHTGNDVASLAASTAGSGFMFTNSASDLSVAGIVATTGGDLQVRSAGNLTLASGARLQADAGDVVAAAEGTGNFINQAGASALVVGSGKRWLVYSSTPDLVAGPHTVKDGLTSDFRHYGDTFATYAPVNVVESGDGFVYSAARSTLTVGAAIVGTASHVYGDNPTGTVGYVISSGLVDSEDNAGNVISGGTALYDGSLTNTMDAGSYSIKYTGGLVSNYSLTASATGAGYTVTPAVLTYTANAASRVYGAADPALGGSIGGFKLGQTSAVLGGAAGWSTPAVVASNAGQYAINGSGYTASNYSFAQAAGNATALTINRALLTVTASGDTKTYDGTAYAGGTGVGYSAFANGEDATVLGGMLAYAGTAQGARNAGSYAIAPTGLTSGNYDITFTSGTLVVGKANLTLVAGHVTKTYDGTLAATGAALATAGTQLFGSDSVSGGTFAFTNANAGVANKTVTTTGVTVNDGNGGNNYLVSYATNGTSTIGQANITVAAGNISKTYDGTTSAAATATVVSGTLFNNASNGGVQDSLAGGSFAFSDANAGNGNKTVTASGVTVNDGNSGANYSLSYADNTTSSINRAGLTFAGTVLAKAYDGTTAATLAGYTLTGFVGAETVGALSSTATFADKNVGVAKAVSIGGITLTDGTNGGLAANYSVSPTASTTGTIDPKLLSLNATVANKVYDGNTSATLQGYGLSGFVGSETVSGVYSGGANFADKNVGTGKGVTIAGIVLVNGGNGGLATNYAVPSNASSNADITPATLQVAGVVAVDKVYDGTLAAQLNTQAASLTGAVGSDDVQVGSITGAFLSKDVGANKPIGTGTFVLTGSDAGNYNLVQPSGLTASITPRSLSVSATGVDKLYDGTTAATVNLSDNRIAGDTLSVNASAAFLDPNIGVGKYVGVSSITLGGTDAGNYAANANTATFATVDRATLTVFAIGLDKIYDGSTFASVTLTDNHVGSEVLTLSYGVAAFGDKNAGSGKTVTVGGISVSGSGLGNYAFNTTATTTATITPATITQVTGITAADKVYDGTTTATLATGTLGFVGMLAGDSLTASAVNAVFNDKNAGTAKAVTIGGLALGGIDAGNYVLQAGPMSSSADITPALLVVTATAQNKVYDATTAAVGSLADARFTGDMLTLAFADAAFADKNAGTGKTVTVSGITLSGADAGNYLVAASATTSADITRAALGVSAVGVNKVYDAGLGASVTLTAQGLANDVLSIEHATAAFGDKNVGSGKTVSVSGITLAGPDAGNYDVASSASTTADITKAALTVGANAQSKVYDTGTDVIVTLTDNRLGNDILSLGYGTAAFADKTAGLAKTVNVGGISVTGADAANYEVNSNALTTADITRAALAVTATASSKVYDGLTGTTAVLADDRMGSDVLSLAYGAAHFADKHAGSGKAVNVTGITVTGADAANYSATGSASATAAITPASLTVGATGHSKLFDGTPLAAVTLTDNRIGGDDLDLARAAATFADAAVGTAKAISVSGITLAGGRDAGNYVLANDSAMASADIAAYTDTWTLPPALPQTLTPPVATPPPALLDLSLPAGTTATTATTATIANIAVSMVRSPTAQGDGLVSVSVPKSFSANGRGFSFALPSEMAQAMAAGHAEVTLLDGQPLPSWLRYESSSKSFVATVVPGGALPIQILVRVGQQRWIVEIAEQAGT